jgi:hypothetical protein
MRYEYVFDQSGAESIAVAPLGPDGKAALIERYNEHKEAEYEKLYLCLEDAKTSERKDVETFYIIEEIDYILEKK